MRLHGRPAPTFDHTLGGGIQDGPPRGGTAWCPTSFELTWVWRVERACENWATRRWLAVDYPVNEMQNLRYGGWGVNAPARKKGHPNTGCTAGGSKNTRCG